MTGQRVAVTGATGFLGSHLVCALTGLGYRVHALARNADKAKRLPSVDRLVIGEITDPSALARLADGCEGFVHLVSNFRTASDPPERYRATNVEGTRAALDAARAAGVRRFVHCSTIGVHGHVRVGPADESSPFAPGDLYQETKLQAECLCRAEMTRPGMEIVIVRPTSIYGPGDMRMLKMFRMLAKRRFVQVGPGRENFHAVYIDDLVDGFIRTLETPDIAGETFIIGGSRYLPLRDYIAVAARAVGAPEPRIRVPYAPLYASSAVVETVCAWLGIEPPLHRRRVRFFRNNRAFVIDKARDRLFYRPQVDLEEGMRRTVAWYRAEGLLPETDSDKQKGRDTAGDFADG